MILYLDTSALVKLYVPETNSAEVKHFVEETELAAVSRIAYGEARAAFARKRRERTITPRNYRTLVKDFDQDWDNFFLVDIPEVLIKRAGSLAEKHALRAYDAVHLASAMMVREQGNQPVSFACFDERLSRAAHREGLKAP